MTSAEASAGLLSRKAPEEMPGGIPDQAGVQGFRALGFRVLGT